MSTVAETAEAPCTPGPAVPRPEGVIHSQLAGTLRALVRLADLQVSIWLSGVKSLVLQLVFVAVLGLLGLLAAIVAILFLYAAVFHIFTDYLHVPTAWALLIFAGAHLALAGAFVVGIVSLLNRAPSEEKKPGAVP